MPQPEVIELRRKGESAATLRWSSLFEGTGESALLLWRPVDAAVVAYSSVQGSHRRVERRVDAPHASVLDEAHFSWLGDRFCEVAEGPRPHRVDLPATVEVGEALHAGDQVIRVLFVGPCAWRAPDEAGEAFGTIVEAQTPAGRFRSWILRGWGEMRLDGPGDAVISAAIGGSWAGLRWGQAPVGGWLRGNAAT